MGKIPTTSTTLLREIAQDSQNARWTEFVIRYRPMMEAFLREYFPTLESDDIIQETLIELCGVLPSYRYVPDEKGYFHNYLTGILRNKAHAAIRKEKRREEAVAGMDVQDSVQPETCAEDSAWRDAVFEIALRQFLANDSISDRTKRIFERTALNGEPPEKVAETFAMTRHAVDQAKSRAVSWLRKRVRQLEAVADG